MPTGLILDGLARSRRAWGRFDVAIDGAHPLLPLVAASMNARSRLTGIATGDQAMFVTREAFDAVGGFPEIALMEDIALARRLKRISPPLCLRARVTTSGRRWEKHGVLRTVLLMWRLRLAYFFGATPAELARRYGFIRRAAVLSLRSADGREFRHTSGTAHAPSGDVDMASIILCFAGLSAIGCAVGRQDTAGFSRLVPTA